MLGFAGLITVLAVLCGSILMRSLETYRAAAFHHWRLQARAAAEGAAVAMARSPELVMEPLELGETVVTPGEPAAGDATPDGGLAIPLRVEVSRGGRVVYAAHYSARFVQDLQMPEGIERKLIALEAVR